jgi:hypothetical protein
MPLHVPSAVAQKECIHGAYARAGKNTCDADFAELHITGISCHITPTYTEPLPSQRSSQELRLATGLKLQLWAKSLLKISMLELSKETLG